jgi:hypothetical protein
MSCKFIERGWSGYLLDVVTMGGFTVYRVNEYSKCIQEQNKKTLKEFSDNHIQLQKHQHYYHKNP